MTIDFGLDISCIDDFADDGRSVTGRRLLAEAVCRRYNTPRGQLIDDPNYGYFLPDFINADVTTEDIGELQAGAAQEAEKDERVDSATADAVLEADGTLTLTVTLDDGDGPFQFVASVTDVTVELLTVEGV